MSAQGPIFDYEFKRVRAPRSTGIDLVGAPDGRTRPEDAAGCPSKGRLPRVTRLLALAHRFADLLARGEVPSMAELARAGGVTRARLSQILDLTLLAPDIQEEILAFRIVESGRDPVTTRELRTLTRSMSWPEQRRAWRALRTAQACESIGPRARA